MLKQLGLPAVSGSIAVCFSHPLELTKARLQLDNELAQRGASRAYQGWVDCVAKNWQKGGLRGLQSGLFLGVTREFFFNGIRIGGFEPLVALVQRATGTHGAPPKAHEKLAGGLSAGALGGLLINPIDVCKTRAQIAGGLTGYQHTSAATGALGALAALVQEEGVRGLFRGIMVNTLRGFLGPGSQITSYNMLKEQATLHGADATSVTVHVSCSLTSAAISIACVNPVDVIRTRLYNQPFGEGGVGLRYASGLDAFLKLVSTEGPAALYKGALAHYARLGPHMVFVFVIFEQLKNLSR